MVMVMALLVIIRYAYNYSSHGVELIGEVGPSLFTNKTLFPILLLQFRFTLLCHAACEAPLVLPLGGFTYGEKCLFLVNDWHAGLVPV